MAVPEEVKTLIKDSVDVESLLLHLGFKITRSTGSEVRAPCVIHGGDNPTGFSMRLATRKWKCFTHKCELSKDGKVDNDLIALVMKASGLPFFDALQVLSDFSGLGIDVRANEFNVSPDYNQKKDMERFMRRANSVSPTRPTSNLKEETILGYKVARDSYFIDQGFSVVTLDFFEIGSMIDRWGVMRASIPIRDERGELLGISLRRTDGDEEPRYVLSHKFPKDLVLYNLYRAKQMGGTVILVEGFKACWALYEAGYPNVVACMGSVLTDGQFHLLVNSGISRVVLLLDGDGAGRDGTTASYGKLHKAFQTTVISLPDNKSPDDFDRVELNEYVALFCK